MTGSGRRQKAERHGRRAETLAALALMLKGFRIAARRYRCPLGEVDLIARKGDLVLLVEVKARGDLMTGAEAVSAASARRIAAAGEHWIARQNDAARLSWRNDLMVVRPWRWPIHIEEAF